MIKTTLDKHDVEIDKNVKNEKITLKTIKMMFKMIKSHLKMLKQC